MTPLGSVHISALRIVRIASSGRGRFALVTLLVALFVLPGCEYIPGAGPTRADRLQREVDVLKHQMIEDRREGEAERARLENEYAEKFEAEQQRAKAAEAQLVEIKGLNAQRASGIQQSFFGGDIIYVVAPEGFADYRAALRYRSLSDSKFEAAFERYENREGGDADVLRVLQEMDFNQDQLITREEARAFKSAEEKAYRPGPKK